MTPPFDRKAYMKEYNREYEKTRPPRDRTEYHREWHLKNREHRLSRSKEYDRVHREERLARGKKRVSFKDTRLTLPYTPRKNVCLRCGNSYPEGLIRQTTIYHTAYHDQFPLSARMELCNKCHQRLHKRNDKVPLPPLAAFY